MVHLKTTLLTEVRGGVFPEVPINTLENVPYPLPTDTDTPDLREPIPQRSGGLPVLTTTPAFSVSTTSFSIPLYHSSCRTSSPLADVLSTQNPTNPTMVAIFGVSKGFLVVGF
jgi:hypothetical protein